MLVLKRKEGQWVEITHSRTGDVLRVRLYDVCGEFPGRANLAFDDPDRNFCIQRPERPRRPTFPPTPTPAVASHAAVEGPSPS